ncbi:hypothetical protein FS837_007044, partial [Tulasnella sp. UAMH 9824]
FKGTDGCECEAFVVAVRELAFAKGLEEDYHWMLHFATTKLRGKALRWHARLEPSIKRDWELFVHALFDQYPFVEEPKEPGIVTPSWSSTTLSPRRSSTPLPDSAANYPDTFGNVIEATKETLSAQRCELESPSSGSRPSLAMLGCYRPSAGQQIGRLRVVNQGDTTPPQYIRWGHTMEEASELGKSSIDDKRTTTNQDEALLVSFVPSSTPHRISCL